MVNFTSNTYQMKREILSFSNKISRNLPERLTLLTVFPGILQKEPPKEALKAYLAQVKKWCPDQPVIHIDDRDVVKPDGYKFESLGWVRDGLESTATKNVYKKGLRKLKRTSACKIRRFMLVWRHKNERESRRED